MTAYPAGQHCESDRCNHGCNWHPNASAISSKSQEWHGGSLCDLYVELKAWISDAWIFVSLYLCVCWNVTIIPDKQVLSMVSLNVCAKSKWSLSVAKKANCWAFVRLGYFSPLDTFTSQCHKAQKLFQHSFSMKINQCSLSLHLSVESISESEI